MATLMSSAEYSRLKQAMLKLPVLAARSNAVTEHGPCATQPSPTAQHDTGAPQAPLHERQCYFEVGKDRYGRHLPSENFTSPSGQMSNWRAREQRLLHGPRPARKARVLVKDEDRLTELRLAKAVQEPYPEGPTSTSRRLGSKDAASRSTSNMTNSACERRESLLRNLEAPCKELRLLSSELTQKDVQQFHPNLGKHKGFALENNNLLSKAARDLSHLPEIRLLPPPLAGAQLSKQGIEHARQPISATFNDNIVSCDEWSPLNAVDEQSTKQSCTTAALLEDPIMEQVYDLIKETEESLADCMKIDGQADEQIWFLTFGAVSVMLTIGLCQALFYAWTSVLDRVSFCGNLCWLFPD